MYTSAIDELLNLERGIQELFEFVPSRVAAAMPAINVVEAKDHYQISVELPGLVKDDVKISLDKNQLTISGERKPTNKTEGTKLVRSESWNGKFNRTIELPDTVDSNNISAELTNGILTVSVPKAEETKPREISIR